MGQTREVDMININIQSNNVIHVLVKEIGSVFNLPIMAYMDAQTLHLGAPAEVAYEKHCSIERVNGCYCTAHICPHHDVLIIWKEEKKNGG